MRSSPKFSHEPLNEFFYHLAMDSGGDEQTGDSERTAHTLFRFKDGLDPALIDAYNSEQDAFENQLHAAEIAHLCVEAIGAILHESSDGSVRVDTYTDATEFDLENDWQDYVSDDVLEFCDECGAEAETYGADSPIEHAPTCSMAT